MAVETIAGATTKRSKGALVVAASASGTVFEWYDFFIFGTLTPIITRHFFSGLPESVGFIVALLLFGVGFGMRPVGALVFGPIGDLLGRKRAFLFTVTLMGGATFLIGFLPTNEQVGGLAPVLLLVLRCVQGFALGGEYGGAAIYVAEHAPHERRGLNTSWIQTAASLGLVAALLVILTTRTIMGEEAFSEWGWRIPFLLSAFLLLVSVWIRMQLEESPTFKKMKEEGRHSKAPLAESFLQWKNLKLVLLALFAVMIAQGVVWYAAHFYVQFYLERVVKLPATTVNMLMIAVVTCSAPLYILFAWISDRIGRKPVMLAGIVVSAVALFPGFQAITRAANPPLWEAMQSAPVVVVADPADCSVQFDPIGRTTFDSSCDIAKAALSNAGVSYGSERAQDAIASVRVGEAVVPGISGEGMDATQLAAARTTFSAELRAALDAAGYPAVADPAKANMPIVFAVMLLFAAAAAALYGPQAAALVELFPARIRYTALSLPYHIGTGWFGGFLPAIAFALVVGTGNIFSGLWYPIVGAVLSAVVMLFCLPETKDRDITT